MRHFQLQVGVLYSSRPHYKEPILRTIAEARRHTMQRQYNLSLYKLEIDKCGKRNNVVKARSSLLIAQVRLPGTQYLYAVVGTMLRYSLGSRS